MSSGQEACQSFSASSYPDLIAQSEDILPRWRRTAEEIAAEPAAAAGDEAVRLLRVFSLQI